MVDCLATTQREKYSKSKGGVMTEQSQKQAQAQYQDQAQTRTQQAREGGSIAGKGIFDLMSELLDAVVDVYDRLEEKPETPDETIDRISNHPRVREIFSKLDKEEYKGAVTVLGNNVNNIVGRIGKLYDLAFGQPEKPSHEPKPGPTDKDQEKEAARDTQSYILNCLTHGFDGRTSNPIPSCMFDSESLIGKWFILEDDNGAIEKTGVFLSNISTSGLAFAHVVYVNEDNPLTGDFRERTVVIDIPEFIGRSGSVFCSKEVLIRAIMDNEYWFSDEVYDGFDFEDEFGVTDRDREERMKASNTCNL